MKNILSIYEFHIPFISDKNENLKYITILEDLRKLLLYEEILLSVKREQFIDYEIIVFEFSDGYIRINYSYNIKNYYIPVFQLDLFSKIKLKNDFIENLCLIFYSVDYKGYIFEIIEENIKIVNLKLLYLDDLQKSFNIYSFDKLKDILENDAKEYIADKIIDNENIKNSLLYMIFTCFNLYKNIYISGKSILKLEQLSGAKLDEVYIATALLSNKRLSNIKNISIQTFTKYKALLDKLFNLFLEISTK